MFQMDKEDLLALTPDIDLLLNRYELSAKKRIGKAGLDEIETIAMSMHISPLMQAEFTLNTVDAASLTHVELFNLYSENTNALEFKSGPRVQIQKKELEQNKLFDASCDTVDPDASWWDPGKLEWGKHPDGKYQKGAGFRLTNPIKQSTKSNLVKDLNKYWTEDLGQSQSFEDCFNCDLSFNIDTTYPAIEFTWEFDKILKQFEAFLNMFKKNMDPTNIFNQLCKFKLLIQKNYLCPANMQNFALMIPALFAKYSIDLANLGLDWNWLLGGILKTLFTYIINFLEHIRSLILPFIDCWIGAVNTTFGYIKSIVKALNKGIQTVNDAIERGVDSIAKAGMLIGDMFSQSDSEKQKEKIEQAEKTLKDAEAKLKAAKEELEKTDTEIRKNQRKIQEIKSRLKEIAGLLEHTKIINWILAHGEKYKHPKRKGTKSALNYNEFQKAFKAYLEDVDGGNTKIGKKKNVLHFLAKLNTEQSELKKSKRSKTTEAKNLSAQYASGRDKVGKVYEKMFKDGSDRAATKKKVDKAKEKLATLAKEKFYERYTQRKKSFSGGFKDNKYNGLLTSKSSSKYKTGWLKEHVADFKGITDGLVDKINDKNGWSMEMANWLSDEFSIDISNEYVRNEYWSKDFNKTLNSWEKSALDGLEIARTVLVDPAEDLKKFVNDFIGNVINAVRNLSFLFEKGAELELKILGEILQLAHLVRLFNLIMKLAKEGISSCDELKENKENQEILKQSIEELNQQLEVSIVDNEDPEFNTEFKVAKIFSRNTNNTHLLNFDDCTELGFHMKEKNPNLELIYNSLKANLIK